MASSHQPIWALPVESVYEALNSAASGLSEDEAAHRLQQFGANELPEPAQRPLWLRFTDQLTHFMALLLWVAGTLAFISRTPELGWAIWTVIWINAIFSFWQEFQAEQALAALKKVLPMQVKVERNGQLQQIPAGVGTRRCDATRRGRQNFGGCAAGIGGKLIDRCVGDDG
jgi:magnesium-transporting ATPase (P-type)